jgi:hypothetical protein
MNTLETIKITNDGSKQMKFNGIEFWTNRYNKIMYVPSNEWSVVDQLVAAGLATKKNYRKLLGHTEYTLAA